MNSKFLNSKFRVSKLKISSLKFEAGKLSLTGHRTVQEKQQREKPERCDVFVSEMPTYGDLKSGDFFHPVSPPLPLDQPTHSPSPLPPSPLNAPTHPPAAPSEYKNILPPL